MMSGSWKEKNTKMDDEKMYVPYIVYEGEMARQERQIKRLIVTLIIILVLFFASNMAWLYVWNQYEYVDEDVTVDSQDGGNANYIGNDGAIINGYSNSKEKKTQEEER